MARFDCEVPNEFIKQFDELKENCEDIFGEMVKAGGQIVYDLVQKNMRTSFKTVNSLQKGLRLTKVYKTPSDDGINVHVGFYGYVDGSKKTSRHKKGTPIPLIAMAREYGTSRGEAKKPFFRRSFNKAAIEAAMKEVEEKRIKGD